MKEINFEKSIEEMSDLIHNKKRRTKGFPVSCVFLNKNNDLICSDINKGDDTNKKSIYIQTNHKNHAEYLCLQEIEKDNLEKIIAIITLPPCNLCLDEMVKRKTSKWQIFYIIDDLREKTQKPYIKKFKNEGHEIKKLDLKILKSNNTKLRYLYCWNKVIDKIYKHFLWKKEKADIMKKCLESKKSLKHEFKKLKNNTNEKMPKWLKEFANEVDKNKYLKKCKI